MHSFFCGELKKTLLIQTKLLKKKWRDTVQSEAKVYFRVKRKCCQLFSALMLLADLVISPMFRGECSVKHQPAPCPDLPAGVSSCLSCPTLVNQLQKWYPFWYVLKHIQSLLKYIYSVFVYMFKRKSTCGYLYMRISSPVLANQCVCLSCRCSRGLVSRNIAQFKPAHPPRLRDPSSWQK